MTEPDVADKRDLADVEPIVFYLTRIDQIDLKLSLNPVEYLGRYIELSFPHLDIAPFEIRKGRFQFVIRLDITPIHKQLPADFNSNISFRRLYVDSSRPEDMKVEEVLFLLHF